MLGKILLGVSRHTKFRQAVTRMPSCQALAAGHIAGETPAEALQVADHLCEQGMLVSIGSLVQEVFTLEQAQGMCQQYLQVLHLISQKGLGSQVEVSIMLPALGQLLPEIGLQVSAEHARTIAHAARNAGTSVTLEGPPSHVMDDTISQAQQLGQDLPLTGVSVQANLHRTESDCRWLARQGMRVRLRQLGRPGDSQQTYSRRKDIDRSFARCLGVLMAGAGVPMVATHDPMMIDLALHLAARYERAPDSFEVQMLHGMRTGQQQRLTEQGYAVRVYVPYGTDWYPYLMRRWAEKPLAVGGVLAKSAQSH